MIGRNLMLTFAIGLCASSAGTAQPSEPTAQEVFHQFEDKVKAGKSLFVAYIGSQVITEGHEANTNRYGGTFHVRPGFDRLSRTFTQSRPYVGYHSRAAPKNYFGPVTRNGLSLNGPFQDELLPVSDFAFASPKGGLNLADSQVLQYTLRLNHVPPSPTRAVQLWLDEDSLAPLQRSVQWMSKGREYDQTERYYAFSSDTVPEPFEREPVPAFVLSGQLSARLSDRWIDTVWLVEDVQYAAREETRLLFGGGAKITLASGSEWKVTKNRAAAYDLQIIKGQLSAELREAGNLHIILGHVRLAGGPNLTATAVLSATPDRVFVEQGSVECSGACVEPRLEGTAFSRSGHILQRGMEYGLSSGTLMNDGQQLLPSAQRW